MRDRCRLLWVSVCIREGVSCILFRDGRGHGMSMIDVALMPRAVVLSSSPYVACVRYNKEFLVLVRLNHDENYHSMHSNIPRTVNLIHILVEKNWA